MTVGGIQHQRIHLRIHQRRSTLKHIRRGTDRRRTEQPAILVPGGIRIFDRFFNVLDGDQALKIPLLVHNRQLLDTVAAEDFLRLLHIGTHRRGDQVVLGHDLFNLLREVGQEPHVAVGENTHQLAVAADRHAGNLVFAHQLVGVRHQMLRREEKRVDDDAVFRALNPVDVVSLVGDGHVFMDDADAALAGNGNCHRRFGHRIHCRRHQRSVQGDVLGQPGLHRDLLGKHIRFGRDQQHIVKGQPFFEEFFPRVRIDHVFSSFIFRRASRPAPSVLNG